MQERFGLCHADDTYALICNKVRAIMDGTTYDVQEDVEKFKKHWLGYGLDPKTMNKIAIL